MSSAPEAFERWWQALPLQNGEITADHIRQAWDAGVLLEREACVRVVREYAERMKAAGDAHSAHFVLNAADYIENLT